MAAWIVNDGALLIPIPMAVLMSYSLSSIQWCTCIFGECHKP
jgi:hypothetical protein